MVVGGYAPPHLVQIEQVQSGDLKKTRQGKFFFSIVQSEKAWSCRASTAFSIFIKSVKGESGLGFAIYSLKKPIHRHLMRS